MGILSWVDALIWGPGGRADAPATTSPLPAPPAIAPRYRGERRPRRPRTLGPTGGTTTIGATTGARALAGGRLTTGLGETGTASQWRAVRPPDDWAKYWTTYRLDARALDSMNPSVLLQVLADLSPDVSRALWDFNRMCNPGFELVALAAGPTPDNEQPSPEGQAVLNQLLELIATHYGSPDAQFGRLFINLFLRGNGLAELVLDRTGRTAVDFVVPDAATLRFRPAEHPERGTIQQPGQMQRGTWVAFERPTIAYVAVDPYPDNPYGRPLAAAALNSTLFAMAMLSDLRRVVAQQGYPRLDIAVDLEKLRATMPPAAANDPERYIAWVQAIIDQVTTQYARLQPDDAFVHTNVVVMNRPIGTVDISSLGAIDGLITALERQAVRALKTMPLMFGLAEGTSEANANRQWEVYAASIKALQHLAEGLVERLCNVALQAAGVPAVARLRFAELRAAEMLRDAQTEAMRIDNAARKRDQGWITQDEASQEVTGHAAVGPAPAVATSSDDESDAADDAAEAEPDPGANRTPLVALNGAAHEHELVATAG